MKYKYGSCRSGWLFWKRLFCRHDFKSLDVYGKTQRCRKCGLYRSSLHIKKGKRK